MKYPWMPLFWGDFLANTMHLSAQEAGAYLFLIAHAWENDGKIPGERVRLARIAHVRDDQWNRVWNVVQRFFEAEAHTPLIGRGTHQCYTHRRVTTELHRLGKISSKRKAAAVQKHSKSSANAEQMHMQTTLHPTSKANKDFLNGEGSKAPTAKAAAVDWRNPGDDYRSPPREKSDKLTDTDAQILAALQRKGGPL